MGEGTRARRRRRVRMRRRRRKRRRMRRVVPGGTSGGTSRCVWGARGVMPSTPRVVPAFRVGDTSMFVWGGASRARGRYLQGALG
eukprot:9471591-Pyramimonas_sp.AAC.1